MPDIFTLFDGETAAVDGSEGKSKKLFNTGPDHVYYMTEPGDVGIYGTRLEPGKSVELTDRNWFVTNSEPTKVIVTEASEEG